MASDAMWVVNVKCIVKGYQECRFDVKEGEEFKVSKKIREKGHAFHVENERGQLGRIFVLERWAVECGLKIIKGENYLQTHGTAMGTKVAIFFANIFMSVIETEIINKSKIKPLEWKRYVDDVFSLWDTKREEIDQFILEANRHHPIIKFTADISD